MSEKLHKETIKYCLEHIKETIKDLNPELDFMSFSGYDENQEDHHQYGFWYNGPGEPKQPEWKLAQLYLTIKQCYEYDAGLGLSFGMQELED